VHAFLEIFCSLNTVFWTRQTQQHAQITEQHEMRLGAGNDKMGNFKLYVQRGNEIEEHVVSKSRYARGNVSINTNAVRPGRILGAGGEEISEKKAELEQRIARAKQQRDELDRTATQRKGEMDNLMRQITELKHVRMQLQRSIMAPKDLERKLISDQKKVEDIAKRLQGDIAKEREQKRKAYAKAIENFLTAMEGLVKSGRDILGLDVQKNVTALARRELKRDISIASAALDDARSSLAQLKKDLTIAKKEREEAQVKFATAEKKLEEMQSEMGIEGFKAFYLQVIKGMFCFLPLLRLYVLPM
jgi:predicted  nucleic acid-binding Zn-ribbon protein